jgi:hypothetical protein
MSALVNRSFVPKLAVLGGLALVGSLALAAHVAAAPSAAVGSVTGRVMWGSCVRGVAPPMTPDGQTQQPGAAAPGVVESQPAEVQPMPAQGQGQVEPSRPIPGRPMPVPAPITGLPAGAVLVAVQNTSISARTDEAGRFSLSNVPAGTYLTVAAGPVASSMSATADRPNVFINGGETVDIGTLALGGSAPYGIACRLPMLDTPDGGPGAPAQGAP